MVWCADIVRANVSAKPRFEEKKMDFALDQDQSAIRDLARSFAADEMAPHAAAWDAKEIFPVDVLRRAASHQAAPRRVG